MVRLIQFSPLRSLRLETAPVYDPFTNTVHYRMEGRHDAQGLGNLLRDEISRFRLQGDQSAVFSTKSARRADTNDERRSKSPLSTPSTTPTVRSEENRCSNVTEFTQLQVESPPSSTTRTVTLLSGRSVNLSAVEAEFDFIKGSEC